MTAVDLAVGTLEHADRVFLDAITDEPVEPHWTREPVMGVDIITCCHWDCAGGDPLPLAMAAILAVTACAMVVRAGRRGDRPVLLRTWLPIGLLPLGDPSLVQNAVEWGGALLASLAVGGLVLRAEAELTPRCRPPSSGSGLFDRRHDRSGNLRR